MKRKLTSIAALVGLFSSLALLAIMIANVATTVVGAVKGGGQILNILKGASMILQICTIILAFVGLCLNAPLTRAFKFDKSTFKEKFATIVAAIVFNFLPLFVFIAFVALSYSVANVVEVALVGVAYFASNILYLVDLIKPKKKRHKTIKKNKKDDKSYTIKDKAQDLLLLIDLRDSKAITQEEYEKLKQEILQEKIKN